MEKPARLDSPERVLARLASTDAQLLPLEDNALVYGAFPRGDRRRRPLARIDSERLQNLVADGALKGDLSAGFTLTDAGHARVRRATARVRAEAFQEQHQVRDARTVVEPTVGGGKAAPVQRRANLGASPIDWLYHRAGPGGKRLLSDREYAAGRRLRDDHEMAARGPRVTADWSAPPQGRTPRGASAGPDLGVGMRARDRMDRAFTWLGPQLASVVRKACLDEVGLEAIEDAHGWPKRSGKVVLKIGLDRLADFYATA